MRRRWIDEPIPIASRYLTTVRRATSKPFFFSKPAIASSLRISVSASISSLIAGLHRLGRAPPSPSAEATPEPKKYLSSNRPRSHSRYLFEVTRLIGRFVHADRLGDLAQRHRLHRRHPALEEALLALDDLRHDLDDRPRALVERLDQPVGALQAFAEPGPRRLVLRAGLQLLIIAAVDQQPRQRRLVQLDGKAARGSGGRTRRA